MMKAKTPLSTNYLKNINESDRLLRKFDEILSDALPNDILGMLVTATADDQGVIFYNRWQLQLHKKHDYEIVDLYTQNSLYQHITLLASAMYMIYHLNKRITKPCPVDKIIYGLDQEYYRCLEQIKFYQKKLKGNGDRELFAIKLSDKHYRLGEIKNRLSKIY